jgi:hypothetical protein
MRAGIKVFAPASVANVACGFDILGFALDGPGDEIIARPSDKKGLTIVKITGDQQKLPYQVEDNTAGYAGLKLLEYLGTIFFLFIGIFIFMMLLVEASSSFVLQFQSFIVFIGVGSIALYASLRHKIPSVALTISAFTLPFLTFYAITSFLLGGTLGVCLVIAAAYGFPVIAMLIPAVSEFDMALGRTTLDQG